MAELNGRAHRFLARTPVAAVLVDRDGVALAANDRAHDLFGIEPGSLVGRDCLGLIHPDDTEQATRNLADAASRELPATMRMLARTRHQSGRWLNVHAMAVNLLDEEGFGGILVSLRPADPADELDPRRRGWFEAVVSGTDDIVQVLDEEGRILWASGPVEDLLGIPADALVGLKIEQLRHQPDPEQVAAWFVSVKAASATAPVVLQARRDIDGRPVDLEVRISNLLDDPEVGALVMTTRDITEQVALARSEAHWLTLSKHAHEVVAIIDEHAVVQWAGSGFSTLLDLDAESLVGTSIRDLVHPDDRLRPGGLDDLARDDRTGFAREYRLRNADGGWRVFDVQVADLRDEPSMGAFLVTGRDVTDRAAAEEANRRLATAIESAGAAVIITDVEGRILSWNREAERLSGQKAEQVVGRRLERGNPVPRERREQFRASLMSGATITYETDRLVRDDRRVTLSVTASPITDAVGTLTGFSFIGFDITEQRDAAREREARATQARALAELGQRALSGASVPDVLEDACELAAATMGIPHVQVLLYQEASPSLELAAAVGGLAGHVGRADPVDIRTWIDAGDDQHRPVGVTDFDAAGAPVRPLIPGDGGGGGDPAVRSGVLNVIDGRDGPIGYLLSLHGEVRTYADPELAFLQSIANVLATAIERARVTDEMQRRALHDELTGLPNRALLIDRLTQAVGRLERRPDTAVGLLFIDLDRFKRVNDTLGHRAGDEVLVATAARLLEAVRSGDTVARTGGDEFLVLTEELSDPIGAIALAERIAAAIAEPVFVDGHGLHVTASIGVAIADAASDPEELVRDADLAMYRAKQDGRDRIQVFDGSMRDEAMSGMAMEEALRAAVSARAVRVVFQPQVSMVDGSIQGIEALARWDHPRLGVKRLDFVESRIVLGLFVMFSLVGMMLFRTLIFRPLFALASRKKIIRRKVLIVGKDRTARMVAAQIDVDDRHGFDVVGFVNDKTPVGECIFEELKNLGSLDELKSLVDQYEIKEVIIAESDVTHHALLEIIDKAQATSANVRLVSELYNIIPEKVLLEKYLGVPIVKMPQNYENALFTEYKRVFDVVVTAAGLILMAVPLAVIAFLIKLTSKGPVFYNHTRIGKDCEPFEFYKFRTMYANTDDAAHREFVSDFIQSEGAKTEVKKITNDPRVTSIGPFLRKTSLDELPQLFNVLKGDMSLVGPRPCMPYELEQYQEWHRRRLSVIPGCTGLWQVAGRSAVDFNDMVILDLFYIDNMSPLFDLRIIFRTLPVMLFAKGGH